MILPPDPSRIVEGLRDTGYNFNTAVADIIDNSISHGKAEKVDLRLEMDFEGQIIISLTDNGTGMTMKELENAMRYGSRALDNPENLGKFGLGLKTSSTAICRKLSVIARKKNEINKATWDLNHIAKKDEWELLNPEPAIEELNLFNEITDSGSGTMVIWDNVDRAIKTYDQPGGRYARDAFKGLMKKLQIHLSMVFQKFIDHNVKEFSNLDIFINDKKLEPWDPFCKIEPEQNLLAEQIKKVHDFDNTFLGQFEVNAYVIPRRKTYTSADAEKKARISNDMQGFYIYRHGRLIHHGTWLGMWAREPHYSLCRIEFCFDHKLDDAFQIDIKKSRIMLNDSIVKWLQNQFLPAPRRKGEDLYRKGIKIKDAKEAEGAHVSSNKLIASKEDDLKHSQIDVMNPDTGESRITNPQGQTTLKLRIGKPKSDTDFYVQTVESIDDGLLWEPTIIDGHHAVSINTGHLYYNRVYIPNHKNQVTIQGMDSLLWALCEAEFSTLSESTKNQFKELRYEVSKILRNLVDELPEVEETENDENN